MDNVIIALAVAIAVGAVAIVIGLALLRTTAAREVRRGAAPDSEPSEPKTFSHSFSIGRSAGSTSDQPGLVEGTGAIVDTIGQLASAAGIDVHTAVTTRSSRSIVRLDGATPTVEVDGVTYDSLATVPPDARPLLVNELRLMLHNDLPAPVRSQVEAFLATAGASHETNPPAGT